MVVSISLLYFAGPIAQHCFSTDTSGASDGMSVCVWLLSSNIFLQSPPLNRHVHLTASVSLLLFHWSRELDVLSLVISSFKLEMEIGATNQLQVALSVLPVMTASASPQSFASDKSRCSPLQCFAHSMYSGLEMQAKKDVCVIF